MATIDKLTSSGFDSVPLLLPFGHANGVYYQLLYCKGTVETDELFVIKLSIQFKGPKAKEGASSLEFIKTTAQNKLVVFYLEPVEKLPGEVLGEDKKIQNPYIIWEKNKKSKIRSSAGMALFKWGVAFKASSNKNNENNENN